MRISRFSPAGSSTMNARQVAPGVTRASTTIPAARNSLTAWWPDGSSPVLQSKRTSAPAR